MMQFTSSTSNFSCLFPWWVDVGSRIVVVPLRPGSSSLIEVGRLLWEFGYDSATRVPDAGALLETSWAKGETGPRVILGGFRVLE